MGIGSVIPQPIFLQHSYAFGGGEGFYDQIVQELLIRQIIIASAACNQFSPRPQLQNKKGQTDLFALLPRNADLKGISGYALHHADALIFQVRPCKMVYQTKNSAQHERYNSHIDDYKFHSQPTNHVLPPPDDNPFFGLPRSAHWSRCLEAFSSKSPYKPPHGFPPHQNHTPILWQE